MTVTAIAAGYALVWALEGTPAVSTFGGALLSAAALLAPGIVLVAFAMWLDWR
jgi:hypothetical protein